MSAAVKDIAVGTVVMVACVGLLAVAFSAPTGPTPSDSGGGRLAMGAVTQTNEQPAVPPVAPRSPPSDDRSLTESPGPAVITRDEVLTPTIAFGDESATTQTPGTGADGDRSVLRQDELDSDPSDELTERTTTAQTDPDTRDMGWPPVDDQGEEPTGPVIAANTDRNQGPRTHVVVSGETYQSISSQYYGTTREWPRIQAANNADQHTLMPGMTLIIPPIAEEAVATNASSDRSRDAAAAASNTRTHVVARGESYYTIARDQLGNAQRYRELQELNGIDPYDLQVGMTIRLPAGSASSAGRSGGTSAASSAVSAPAGSVIHVVERGEILGDISQRYYGTSRRWRAIADANAITDPTSLRVGQRLIIPDAAERTAAVPNTSSSSRQSAAAERASRGSGVWHEVVRGDTLQGISQRYFQTTTRHPAIAAANPGIDPNRLVVGARLWIPDAENREGSSAGPETAPERSRTPAPATGGGSDSGPDWGSVLP